MDASAFLSWLSKEVVYLTHRLLGGARRSRVDTLVIEDDVDVEWLRRELGRLYFDAGWLLSYHYYGEDANMRRPIYSEIHDYPWRQVHLRVFGGDGGLEIDAHCEPAPLMHPWRHKQGAEKSVEEGVDTVALVLEEIGVSYRVESVSEPQEYVDEYRDADE